MIGPRASSVPGQPWLTVLAVVGVGLIGGSFAAALSQAGVVGRILGVGRHAASLAQACKLGLIDEAVTLQKTTATADLIFLARPVGAPGARLRPEEGRGGLE